MTTIEHNRQTYQNGFTELIFASDKKVDIYTTISLMYLRNKPGLCARQPSKLNSKGQKLTCYNILQCQLN